MHYHFRGLFVLLFLLSPAPVYAQFGVIDALFKDVSHVGISSWCWNLPATLASVPADGDCPRFETGFGIEVVKGIRSFYFGGTKAVSWTETQREIRGADTVKTFVPPKGARVPDAESLYGALHTELGIGYSQFTGFRAPDNSPFALSGDFREFPSVSGIVRLGMGYQPFNPDSARLGADLFNPLEGGLLLRATTGLITANNLRARFSAPVDTNRPNVPLEETYAGTGTSFQFVVALGLYFTVSRTTVEFAWVVRSERSLGLAWEGKATDSKVVPVVLPESFDFGGKGGHYRILVRFDIR